MPLILKANSLIVIKWWVDALCATHGDCRGHTRATMSLGRGSVIGMSMKKKLNTKSSTECKMVGVDNASPQMLWTKYFVEGQGYGVKASILNQDNLSAILLEKDGRASSSKRSKHKNVWYFFIKDRIASGEITVEHCPATEMLGDHFTKPLQGTMFRKFRAEIQGIPVSMCDADLGWDIPSIKNEQKQNGASPSPQECVGTHEDCSYMGREANVATPAMMKSKEIEPTVVGKDTMPVSLCTTVGCAGGRRAADLYALVKAGSYACVLKG
jgi:hypothetical protein